MFGVSLKLPVLTEVSARSSLDSSGREGVRYLERGSPWKCSSLGCSRGREGVLMGLF